MSRVYFGIFKCETFDSIGLLKPSYLTRDKYGWPNLFFKGIHAAYFSISFLQARWRSHSMDLV